MSARSRPPGCSGSTSKPLPNRQRCQLAAGYVAALEHQHLAAGLRKVGGGDEAVVAGADDDDVGVRHGGSYRQSFRTSFAASLPAAPMTPPPGCAPDAPK